MEQDIRQLILSAEFSEYYNALEARAKEKFDYVMQILKSQKVINSKFVKSIEKTDLYEMRVSVGTNEHRTFLFAIDKASLIESTQVILLNCFLKKDSKQYSSEINKAKRILKSLED